MVSTVTVLSACAVHKINLETGWGQPAEYAIHNTLALKQKPNFFAMRRHANLLETETGKKAAKLLIIERKKTKRSAFIHAIGLNGLQNDWKNIKEPQPSVS